MVVRSREAVDVVGNDVVSNDVVGNDVTGVAVGTERFSLHDLYLELSLTCGHCH